MAEKTQETGKFVVVKWNNQENKKEIDKDRLGTFVKGKSQETPKIKIGEKKCAALLEFGKDKNVEFLRHQWKDASFWQITSIEAVHESASVRVSGLPEKCARRDVYNFFTNETMVDKLKLDVDVDERYFQPHLTLCVLNLKTAKEVADVCKRQTKFKSFKGKHKLVIEPFYDDIHGIQTEIVVPPLTIEGIDITKLTYMKEFWRDDIEQELDENMCTHVSWPNDPQLGKLKFEFTCKHDGHKVERGKKWESDIKKLIDEKISTIEIDHRKYDASTWQQVKELLETYTGNKVSVEEEENKLTLVGLKEEKEMAGLQESLNKIKPPKPKSKIRIPLKQHQLAKLQAFKDLGLKDTIEHVDIDVSIESGIITIEGDKDTADEAELTVLALLGSIIEFEFDFPTIEHKAILTTPLMMDKMKACIDDLGTRCGFMVTEGKIILFSNAQQQLHGLEREILDLVVQEDIKLKGKIPDKAKFEKEMKDAEEKYTPYVKLSYTPDDDCVVVKVVCGKDYFKHVSDFIGEHVDSLLKRTEIIHISQHIVMYIQQKAIDSIKQEMKKTGLDHSILKYNKDNYTLSVEGVDDVRKKVITIVHAHAKKIHASWRNIEENGIDAYFHDDSFYEFLKSTQNTNDCKFKIATKREMKDNNMHCIVVLDSGQAIFVGAGSLTDRSINVDVVVNPTNAQLDLKKGLGADLVKKGGRSIQADCDEYLKKKQGALDDGDIFVGKAGKLGVQKIIHVVAPKWQGGGNNEEDLLKKAMEAVLDTMNKDSEFILRSVAMPLIGHGQMGFAADRSARIMLRTIKEKYKNYQNIREIYFYDFNPATVRTIQSEMQRQFGSMCYHLPVENVGIGKETIGVSGKGGQGFFCLRSGSRTLPMPGGKSIIIKWGKLQETAAKVIVNPTTRAPYPTGKVTFALQKAAGNIAIDAECKKEFEKRFGNKTVPDGEIAVTFSGNLPCENVYHLKIAQKWNDKTGKDDLESYIRACLTTAMKQNVESIAMPTIGTADPGYSAVEVAQVSLRTVADFMKKKPTCKVEKVIIVIYETDLATTAAFEKTMEDIFKQRPHRLQSEIRETVTEQGPGATQFMPFTGQTIPRHVGGGGGGGGGGGDGSNSGPGGQYIVNGNVTLDLVRGSIELAKADAIVCTTSAFPKLYGAIANAITKAGGPSLQRHLTNNYKGYPAKGAASSPSGSLKTCQRVIYTVLEEFKVAKDNNVLTQKVTQCLAEAETQAMKSIAMPTFGTGGFKFPDQLAAQQMYKAITDFFKTPRTSLSHVVIVMFGPATATNKVFEDEARKYFQLSTASKPAAPPADQVGGQVVMPTVSSSVIVQGDKMIVEKCTLELSYGNLEESNVDVIMDTTTSFPTLNGIIPQTLVKVAGKELADECKKKGQAKEGDIVETGGYKLQCSKVYHYVLPNWKSTTGEQLICDCMKECFKRMKNSGLKSIAVPSIGTGGAKFDANLVARGIYRAVEEYASANPDCTCKIDLVLYPTATEVNKVFTHELSQRSRSGSGTGPLPKPKKGVKFSENVNFKDEGYDDAPVKIPTQKRDFVLLQFMSDRTKNVEEAFKAIKVQVKKDTKNVDIPLKLEDNVDDLEMIKRDKKGHGVEDYGPPYNVSVTVDEKKRKIFIKGIGDTVVKCYEKILKHLYERRTAEMARGIGQTILKHIEWYYTEDDGVLWVPYPRQISFTLEEAFETQANEKEFRDSDDKTYVVNFKDCVEYIKDKKEKATTVTVIRKDLTEGSIVAFPDTWTVMPDMDNLKEDTLKKTDQEFKDVETNFNATLGRVANIKEIRRIQNRSLYQQYHTKKQQLESEHKNLAYPIERTLWHGTSEDVEKSITPNGFNRSYAGATFGGVWYGSGVYFAVKSSYSAADSYSPPDNNGGWKHMYQVKVLTANTVAVAKGNVDRFPPLLPGSATDRHNSTCNDVNNPGEFVIFSDTQAYPEYTILFK